MKILALMGSPRIMETYKAVRIFEEKLKALGDFEFNYIHLKDMEIRTCRGCFLCLERGEEFCPHREDDRVKIFNAMMEADGIIFATPNYSLQVTAIMKSFLDRMAYVFHRPRFFHKAFMAFVTQGVYGGEEIVKYLETVGDFWGFNVCRGVCVTTPPGVRLPKEEAKIHQLIEKGARRFYHTLMGEKSPAPSIKKLAIFHAVQALKPYGPRDCDYRYFEEKGWLDAPYFYETKISFWKRILVKFMDWKFAKVFKKMQEERSNLVT